MSSIYDNKVNAKFLDGGRTTPSKIEYASETQLQNSEEKNIPVQVYDSQLGLNSLNMEVKLYKNRSDMAMGLVDDIVLKNYLTKLSTFDVVPCKDITRDNIILFKINKIVYEKDEYTTDKFISIVSAMTYTNDSIYLIVDGYKTHTDFYLGIKNEDEHREMSSVAETFKNSILGQFPGTDIEDYSYINVDSEFSKQDKLLNRISDAISVSSYVGVPSYKNSKGEYTNANFIQGIEKFALAMQGKNYTAVILASNISKDEIISIRNGYESIYTELSAMANCQLAYSTNESLANAFSRTKGFSDTDSIAHTEGVSKSYSITKSSTHTDGASYAVSNGESEDNALGKISKGLILVGGLVASVATGGAALPLIVAGAGAIAGVGAKSKNNSETHTTNSSDSVTEGTSETDTTNSSDTLTKSHTEQFSETDGTTSTIGTSKNFTMTIQNKHIVEIQKRIDKQLERIELCESTGIWSTGAYFVSYDTDRSVAETGATIFRSIMQGEQSGVETSALNTWYDNMSSFSNILQYVQNLSHPIFKYNNGSLASYLNLPATSLLSSKEVSMLIGLPRKSIPGFPVVEHISLGKEVVRLSTYKSNNSLKLGHIFDQGVERIENQVYLDVKSLTQHTFVTGSTGCGKSNTIYYLIKQIRNQPNAPKFLIIEPAKGEYKDVFGNEHIYGTNPLKTPLLKINPFKFPEGVHVLEHVDRLVEIFNVCWPMYAAMPAVLKEAILNSYENCGWDLYNSTNKFSKKLFPTFVDLLNELVEVINNSAYSEEVKSNYQGSLVTRVKSLNNGLNKQIFSGQELGDSALFDENVIVDLSRIGSQETKSLIMGILIMRLNEYRANSDIPHNSELRHITILEEAHNILKCNSIEPSGESGNVAAKSVEMISNAIAEMRTYGEGFIIVDQSPGAVDISAIRNTNTKIIMRLPEDSDRKVAGKASGMRDYQIDEIAKLPTGVAVVYQNDWEEPVLCKIGKFDDENITFQYISENDNQIVRDSTDQLLEILKFLLKGRVSNNIDFNIDNIEMSLTNMALSTSCKICIYELLSEYRKCNDLRIWKDNYFESLSQLVTNILSAKLEVKKLISLATNFEVLTDNVYKLIDDKVYGLPENIKLVTTQCLMRDYSLGGDDEKRIYSAWLQTIKVKNLL